MYRYLWTLRLKLESMLSTCLERGRKKSKHVLGLFTGLVMTKFKFCDKNRSTDESRILHNFVVFVWFSAGISINIEVWVLKSENKLSN